ncbi:PTS sugar transporter subunit IIA [Staphylococcus epidermidis]|uniref:BglG family transcription antiterminator n=1 Tax=Staphylococcus epidermidis TaxID=1282 RepID=UPI002DBC109B|nr:PTS sugar transporter subunit IIA [Staphylococcus epidermidis]MEB7318875.1 PTS sugar transporter subunit IIA [Staphylococcus epidermidis]MEB7345947.1 PTS sugar transporter subunit IIA [Staphylococcus epidermidis]
MIDRQIKLIKLLLNYTDTYISGYDIAKQLNVSNRTIRNDIKTIHTTFLNELILSVQSKGYMLNTCLYTPDEIQSALESVIVKENKLLITIAYRLFMEKHTFTIKELSSTYHLTKSKVIDYVTRIQTWAIKFDIYLSIKKKQGIMIDASTTSISNAVLHINQLTDDDFKVENLILQELPQAHTRKIKQIISKHIDNHQLSTSENKIQQLLVHLILIIKHSQPEEEDWSTDTESLTIAKKCIKDINETLGYQLNNKTSECFSFFISYHFNKFDLGIQQLFIQSYIDRLIELMEQHIGFPFSQDTNIQLSEDEIAFLTIHFQSSIERHKSSHIHVVIACYYGLGISTLLAEKIKQLNHAIQIVDTLKLEDINNYHFEGIDLLITTHDFDTSQLLQIPKVIQVSPLFSDEDAKKIEFFVKDMQNPLSKDDILSKIQLSVESNFKMNHSNHILPIFEKSKEILDYHHATLDGYIESAIDREKQSSTYIGKGIALPHGNPEKVLKSHMIIFKPSQPITWKQHEVKLVFFLAMSKKDLNINRKIIQTIAQLEEDDIHQLCLLDDLQLKNTLYARFKE